jgi:hypothetical protein
MPGGPRLLFLLGSASHIHTHRSSLASWLGPSPLLAGRLWPAASCTASCGPALSACRENPGVYIASAVPSTCCGGNDPAPTPAVSAAVLCPCSEWLELCQYALQGTLSSCWGHLLCLGTAAAKRGMLGAYCAFSAAMLACCTWECRVCIAGFCQMLLVMALAAHHDNLCRMWLQGRIF